MKNMRKDEAAKVSKINLYFGTFFIGLSTISFLFFDRPIINEAYLVFTLHQIPEIIGLFFFGRLMGQLLTFKKFVTTFIWVALISMIAACFISVSYITIPHLTSISIMGCFHLLGWISTQPRPQKKEKVFI